MIYMAEHLENLRQQEKRAAFMSGVSLGCAMLVMAFWGWTPLKTLIPALMILTVFVSFVVLAIAGAAFRIYRGMQVRALKAKLADKD